MKLALIASTLMFLTNYSGAASANLFGSYECLDDCSGHAAGYDWAARHDVTDPSDCPLGNSNSFHEGCLVRAQDPYRGSGEDDDGDPIRR